MKEINESDWKLYRKRVLEWQERYMEELLREYAGIIAGTEPASVRFWKLKERLDADARKPGVQLSMRRSEMVLNLVRMLHDGTIAPNELDEFSDAVKNEVRAWLADDGRIGMRC